MVRRVDETQIERSEQHAKQGKQHTQEGGQQQGNRRQAMQSVLVVGAVIAGDQDADTGRQSAEQSDHQSDQVPAGTDRGLRIRSKKTTDNECVGRVVQQLDQIGQEQRKAEQDDVSPDRAVSHIDLYHLIAFSRNIGVEAPLSFSVSFQTRFQMSRSTSTEEKPTSSSIIRSISGRV